MIGLFAPRYVKNGREMLKAAQKMLNYKRDLLREEDLTQLEEQMGVLRAALDSRDREAADAASQQLEDSFAAHFPPKPDAAIRENCEVFLVAIVVAVGVRTFFLQPFTIPTGSMQPTLNGIRGHPKAELPPNPLVQALHMVLYGRSYLNVVSQEDDRVVNIEEFTKFRFFTYSKIECEHQTFTVSCPKDPLQHDFHVYVGEEIHKGDVVARGFVNTGDHVFVDKMSYNFRKPARGEVFVFNTANIPTNEYRMNPNAPSQFYIKRLAGLPGDKLQIIPPKLYINGHVAQEYGFQRVMSQQDGYNGYSNAARPPWPNQNAWYPPFTYLGRPDEVLTVPDKSYFALGDNSWHSSDSRDWGRVPEENVMGHGLFVYWPFTSHWGFIK